MSTNKAKSRIQHTLSREGSMGVALLTTGQVAAHLGVSKRIVAKWIDTGRLLGFRLPMSKDRRVHPQALADFQRENGFDRARGKR